MKRRLMCFAPATAMPAEAGGSKDDGKLYDDDRTGQTPEGGESIPEDMEVAFPDPIFRAYVLANFDTDGDGKISKEEALAVTGIDVS